MSHIKSQVLRVAAYGIIRREHEILLCRLSPELERHGGRWTLPGGGLDFGEHPEAGMIREVKEETGFRVASSTLLGVHAFTRDLPDEAFQSIQIMYTATILGGSLTYELAGTTDKCEWHPLAAVAQLPTVELVDVALAMLSPNKS